MTIATGNLITAEQVRQVLEQQVTGKHDSFGLLMNALGESALGIYGAFNKDDEGNVREFDLTDFYHRYLDDENGLLNDAQRVAEIHRPSGVLPDQRAVWIRAVVWPCLSENQLARLKSHARTVLEEAEPNPKSLYNAMRAIRRQIRPLLMGEAVDLPLSQGGTTVQDVVDAVEKAVAALNEVERLVLVKTVKDSLFLYEQMHRDEDGVLKDFNVVEWYEDYLLHSNRWYLDALRVYASDEAGETSVELVAEMTERDKHVENIWQQLDKDTRRKLEMVAFAIIADYGWSQDGLESTHNIERLRQVRALVWPLVEKELG